jgi:hypothetical protein
VPNDQPVRGHVREGFEELWGWAEFMAAADRSDFALRYLRDRYADTWPEPVAVLGQGPIFLAEEARTFLEAHPKSNRGGIDPDDVKRIFTLADADVSVADIAEVIGISQQTVYNRLRKRRDAAEAAAPPPPVPAAPAPRKKATKKTSARRR